MLTTAARVYRETRKKHDQLFNVYVMRPLAAVVVAPSTVRGDHAEPGDPAPTWPCSSWRRRCSSRCPRGRGASAAVAVLEASYCLDCADGMLARFKKLASQGGAPVRLLHATSSRRSCSSARSRCARGGQGAWASTSRPGRAGDSRFLLAGIAGVAIIASAISLTNFVRSPEVSGKETTVEAHYETVEQKRSLGALVATFLRFLNHYPSHIWIWALAGRLDAYMLDLDGAQRALSGARLAGAPPALRAGLSCPVRPAWLRCRGCSPAGRAQAASAAPPRASAALPRRLLRHRGVSSSAPSAPCHLRPSPVRPPLPPAPPERRSGRRVAALERDPVLRAAARDAPRSLPPTPAPRGPFAVQRIERAGGGTAVLVTRADESDPIVLALDRDRQLFVREHPVAGITPPAEHLTIAPRPGARRRPLRATSPRCIWWPRACGPTTAIPSPRSSPSTPTRATRSPPRTPRGWAGSSPAPRRTARAPSCCART